MNFHSAAIATLAFVLSACAADYVQSEGPLSDDDFYNLVTCGAPVGDTCAFPVVRWPDEKARDLTYALATPQPDYPVWLNDQLSRELDRAIAHINDAGASVKLRRVTDVATADVVIYPQNIANGDRINGLNRISVDGTPIGAAYVQVWWDGNTEIYDALIVMARDIPPSEVYPILLEEITQSLGPLTDIKNPWYETRSVFSEDSNSVIALGQQDQMVLHRLYP